MKHRNIPVVCCFTALCFGSLFATGGNFANAYVTEKWYWTVFAGAALAVCGCFMRGRGRLFPAALVVMAALCTVQAGYGLLQYFGVFQGNNGMLMTGSFDNPAGLAACLCVGFPCLYPPVFGRHKRTKQTATVAMGVMLVAIALSGSRAGLMSLTAVGLATLLLPFDAKPSAKSAPKIWKYAAIALLTVIVAIGLYLMKKSSADGRLLIWRCSWDMFCEKPLTGYGAGGFHANYMHFQARYFETHPDSPYAMLADNVSFPFNEYLQLAVNYGLLGIACLIVVIWLIIKSYTRIKERSVYDRSALLCLLAIAVFAFFSYPLAYPFVWIAGLTCAVYIIVRANYRISLPKSAFLAMKIGVAAIGVGVAVIAFGRMRTETEWYAAARMSLKGDTDKALPTYARLHKSLRNNELFLYNYASELNVAGRYDESLVIAAECEQRLADYDLELLIADDYLRLQRYDEAESRYRKAAAMCPVRFMPLYRLVKLYQAAGRDAEARSLAAIILQKKVKVPSPEITAILMEMRGIL